MGKKIRELIAEGAREVRRRLRSRRATAASSADELFDIIEPFADYAFNKSHACGYGLRRLPDRLPEGALPGRVPGRAAHERQGTTRTAPCTSNECRGDGHRGAGARRQRVRDRLRAGARRRREAIRFGLSAVRNVGERRRRAASSRRASRTGRSPLPRLLRRVDPTGAQQAGDRVADQGRRVRLARVHARRLSLLSSSSTKVSGPTVAERKAEDAGQFSLFGGATPAVPRSTSRCSPGAEFDKRSSCRFEKEMLGPTCPTTRCSASRTHLGRRAPADRRPRGRGDGELVTAAGIIGGVSRKYTKRGEPYAQFRLEGLSAGVDVVAFPSVYEADPDLIAADRIVLVVGRIDRRGRELQIRANDVRQPILSADRLPTQRRVRRDRPHGGRLYGRRAVQDGGAPPVPAGLRARCGSASIRPMACGRSTWVSSSSIPRSLIGSSRACSARRRPRGTRHLSLPNRTALGMSSSVPVRGHTRDRRVRGRAPHLTPEGRVSIGAFGGDPFAAAVQMVDAGATWLHVVDMDLAFEGEARNLEVVSAIASLEVRVQAGGGVRTRRRGRRAARRRGGPRRPRIRRSRQTHPARVPSCSGNGERLIVGIEVGGDGEIRSRGADPVHLPLMETLGWLAAAAERHVPCHSRGQGGFVDRSRRRSPETGRTRRSPGARRGRDPLRRRSPALRAAGASGAVVGRAALEGTLDLAEARSALG